MTARIPMTWNGCKGQYMAARIMPYLPPITPRQAFIEPFVGMGGVTFPYMSAQAPSKQCALNDANAEVINLWSVLAFHHEEFEARLEHGVRGLSDGHGDMVARAVNFYLGSGAGGCRYPSNTLLVKHFHDLVKVLDAHRTYLYCMDAVRFTRLMARTWSSTGVELRGGVIYADPPYMGTQGYANEVDQVELAKVLHEAAEKHGFHVVLSINECDQERDLYGDWEKHVLLEIAPRSDRAGRTEIVRVSSQARFDPFHAAADICGDF